MGNHVNLGAWPERGGKAVAYAVAFFMLLVLIQWPVGGYSPYDQLPSTSPEQNETMDTDPPAAPVLTSAVLVGSSNEDVLITWSLSSDDGAGDDDVSHYAVYYADAYDYEGDGYSYLGQAGSGETSFAHTLAGDGDWSNYFYYVQANDTSGNGNWSEQAGKFVRFIEKGKHLASVPLVQEDTTLEVVLQTLAGSFKHVRYYKSSDQNNHWKTYWTFKTYRTLFDIDHKMGFWIDMTKDDHLVVTGLVPETTLIELEHNWNLVSYPSFIDRTVSDALAGIDWKKVQGWGATPPYHQKQMSASDIMTAGEGYWIWVDLPQVWEVSNKPTDPPYVVGTNPLDGALDVLLDASVFVKFSKEMNTSSVTWTTIPDPAGYNETWSESNTLLEIHRGVPWPENMIITFEITYAEDLGGLSLVPGPAPNPWSFTTGLGAPPHIIMTNPYDGEVNVDVWTDVTIQFSREIVPGTFHWNITLGPDPGGWIESWSQTVVHNDTVILAHANPFQEVTAYCLNIEHAQDLYGRDMTPSPFCLEFSTSSYGVYILSTWPSDGAVGVSPNEYVIIAFSEPMDPLSVTWTITPHVDSSPTWSDGDKTLTLTHTDPFWKCAWTTVEITGTDTGGRPLVPGPAPNPWSFSVECTKPWITDTDPGNMETGVLLDKSIVVDFSEEMDPASLLYDVTPDPGGWTPSWTNGNTRVTLSHSNPFQEWWRIDVDVTQAQSIFGQDLISGPAVNPWWFETTGYSPYMASTDPADNETGVLLGQSIVIVFSEAMNTATVNVYIDPTITLTKSWVGNTLTLTHANFLPCQAYTVTVEGQDLDGNDLVVRFGYPPNPFVFMTTCTYPYITETRPYDGEQNVDVMKNPQVIFSEGMNPASLIWSITPDPSPGAWDIYWLEPDRIFVQFNHTAAFSYCTEYTMEIIQARDLDGNDIVPGPVPNPWTFTTDCGNPYIVQTDPYDGQLGVPLNQSIIVSFSQAMNASSVSWVVNPFIGYQPSWSNSNMTLTLDHPILYDACQEYEINISGLDLNGQPLVPGPVPNPFSFTTDCGNPYIVQTDPYDGEVNVDPDRNITIWFSEPMDTSTVIWTLAPDPLGWMMNWSANETVLFLNHSNPLSQCIWYTIWVTYGEDKDGNPLVPGPVPNPWNFTTGAYPYILWTDPANGMINVPVDASIQIEFSWAMNQSSFNWTINPDPGGWSVNWVSNSTVVLSHSNPFDPSTTYVFTVLYIEDIYGMPLLGLPAEITFST